MKEKLSGNNFDKLIKILQIASFVFMAIMVIACFIFLSKYDISVKNVDALTLYLTGGTLTVSLLIIFFSIIKSFALVFPPAVLFIVSGIVFKNFFVAVSVNFAATALSLILPYFLGRFTGKGMVDSLKKRFKAINKIDNFADENSFALVLIFKGGGLIPSDLSSLIFGAMNIPFSKYFIASNLGMLILNVLWTIVGVKGDLTNPFSYLYALPALIFAAAASAFLTVKQKKKKQYIKN